jgi:hypothetical protein
MSSVLSIQCSNKLKSREKVEDTLDKASEKRYTVFIKGKGDAQTSPLPERTRLKGG